MWVVVAGTICAPVSLRRTCTVAGAPVMTWPWVGERICNCAGLLGLVAGFGGDPVGLGPPPPFEPDPPPPHAAATSAAASTAIVTPLRIVSPSSDRLVEVRGDRRSRLRGRLDDEPPQPLRERGVRHEVSLVEADQGHRLHPAARRDRH